MINLLFLKVLNMSITASVVILFVLAARFLLRRLPKIFSYLLWGVVIFRLICPFSFMVPFSLLDLTNPKSVENGEVIYISPDILYMGEPDGAGNVLNDGSEVLKQNNMNALTEREQRGADVKTVISVMAYIWLLGILGMAGYSIISFVQLKRKLVGAVKCAENIWISDYVSFSFVVGILRPRIYLWSGLSEEEKGFVIEHEKTHIKRRDYLVKLFFYLVLIVHWFNPLVWLSYFLCMKDMEMSCDENVMKKMGGKVRADYSETLLSLATGRKIFAGTPLFFGEGDTKSRIKNILRYKKPTMWAVAAGVIAVVILCIGFMGNPSESSNGQDGGDIEGESTDNNGVKIIESNTGMFEVQYPQIEFPSQTMNPFTVRLSLPQGWVIGKRDLEAEDIVNLDVKEIIGAFLTTYIFDEDGICVGKMGCNFYEIYEGAEDAPQAIYNQVALGNHYQFDVRNSYEIISQSNMIETATADVLHMESANDGGDINTNYGILSRSKEGLVYVALELESGLVSKEDVTAIAESISFEVPENSQSLPQESGNIPEESTNLQMVWHADLTGDGEEETIVVDSTGWNEEMFVELYVWNKEGMLLWNEEGAYAHMGWNTVFLINISGRDYLLKYNPYMSTGMASYQYEIFGLRNDPAYMKEIYASDTVDFSVYLHDTDNAEEAFDIDRMVEFAGGINGYLSKGLLLFSTEEGELKVGSNVGRRESEFRNNDGSLKVNHDFMESYSFCDDELVVRGIVGEESIGKMELREKLQLYFEKCLLNSED